MASKSNIHVNDRILPAVDELYNYAELVSKKENIPLKDLIAGFVWRCMNRQENEVVNNDRAENRTCSDDKACLTSAQEQKKKPELDPVTAIKQSTETSKTGKDLQGNVKQHNSMKEIDNAEGIGCKIGEVIPKSNESKVEINTTITAPEKSVSKKTDVVFDKMKSKLETFQKGVTSIDAKDIDSVEVIDLDEEEEKCNDDKLENETENQAKGWTTEKIIVELGNSCEISTIQSEEKVTNTDETMLTKNNEDNTQDVDYFDMDCDEINESDYEEIEVSKDLDTDTGNTSSSQINEKKVVEEVVEEADVTIISDDDDDEPEPVKALETDKIETTKKSSPNSKCTIKTDGKITVSVKHPQKDKDGNMPIEKVDANKEVKQTGDAKKQSPKSNENIEVIDLDGGDEVKSTKTPMMGPMSSRKQDLSKQKLQTEESNITDSADPVIAASDLVAEMDNMVCKHSENNPRESIDMKNAEPDPPVNDISSANETSQAAILGLVPASSVSSTFSTRSSDQCRSTSTQLMHSLVSNQGIYVSSGLGHGSIPSLPPLKYVNKDEHNHTTLGNNFTDTVSFPSHTKVEGIHSIHGVQPRWQPNCSYPYHEQPFGMHQPPSYNGQDSSEMYDGYEPPRKRRLLDYDKKWHMEPKYSPEQDKYLALPGGVEANSIATISDTSSRRLDFTDDSWQHPGNYTSISVYPSIPTVNMEHVGGDYDHDNYQYYDNGCYNQSETDDEYLPVNRYNRGSSHPRGREPRARRGRGNWRGRSRGRAGRIINNGKVVSKRGASRSRGRSMRGTRGQRRGRGNFRSRGKQSRSSNYINNLKHSPLKAESSSPSKRGHKIGFYSVKFGFSKLRGSTRGVRGRGLPRGARGKRGSSAANITTRSDSQNREIKKKETGSSNKRGKKYTNTSQNKEKKEVKSRGRPRKHIAITEEESDNEEQKVEVRKPRGRQKKSSMKQVESDDEESDNEEQKVEVRKPRGRPKKSSMKQVESDEDLPVVRSSSEGRGKGRGSNKTNVDRHDKDIDCIILD